MTRRRVGALVVLLLAALLTLASCGKKNEPSAAEQPGLQGVITAIQESRVLLIDRSGVTEQSPNPRAIWVDFKDADIAELRIGNEIRVWTDGAIMESYPEQTTGARYELSNDSVGKGDLQGKVTGIHLSRPIEERTLEIDGKAYRLLPYAEYWSGGDRISATDIEVGDFVDIWFTGYRILDEGPITQVIVLTNP